MECLIGPADVMVLEFDVAGFGGISGALVKLMEVELSVSMMDGFN